MLQQRSLKFVLSKFGLFKDRDIYLAHVVSDEGICTDLAKFEAVKEWPVPKCIKDLPHFLVFTGYDKFIHRFIAISK